MPRKREERGVAPYLTEGWTEELLRKVVPAAALMAPDPEGRDTPHTHHEIHLSGYGVSINKVEGVSIDKLDTERMFWGWVTLGVRYLVPTYVSVDVVEHEREAASQDRRALLVPPGLDAARYVDQDDAPPMERQQVGHVVLNGHGGDWKSDGLERQKAMLPVFEAHLELTQHEWASVRECLEVARWRDGQGPHWACVSSSRSNSPWPSFLRSRGGTTIRSRVTGSSRWRRSACGFH